MSPTTRKDTLWFCDPRPHHSQHFSKPCYASLADSQQTQLAANQLTCLLDEDDTCVARKRKHDGSESKEIEAKKRKDYSEAEEIDDSQHNWASKSTARGSGYGVGEQWQKDAGVARRAEGAVTVTEMGKRPYCLGVNGQGHQWPLDVVQLKGKGKKEKVEEKKKTKANTKANATLEVKNAELDLSTEETAEEEDKKKANPKSKPESKSKDNHVKDKNKAMEVHTGASGSKDFVKAGENGTSKSKGKEEEQTCKQKPEFSYHHMHYKNSGAFGIRRNKDKQIFQISNKAWTPAALLELATKIVKKLNSGDIDEDYANMYSRCKLHPERYV
jgi:hypothetical protein